MTREALERRLSIQATMQSNAYPHKRIRVLTLEMLKPVFMHAGLHFVKDQAPRLSAALTFYMMLALSPLLLFLIGVIGLIQNSDRFRHMLLRQIERGFGPGAQEFLKEMLHKAADTHAGIIAVVLGLLVAGFGASGMFEQLRDSVNAIWEVKPTARSFWQMVLNKLSAFVMVIAGGAVIVLWILFDAWLHYVRRQVGAEYPYTFPIWQLVSFLTTWGFTTPVFTLMFRYLPCKDLKWQDVWLPAFLTGFMFALGKYGLGLYLLFSSANSSYGIAGSIVVVLLWCYYSTQIFFFGVELSKQYARYYGSQIDEPRDHENKVLPAGVPKTAGASSMKS